MNEPTTPASTLPAPAAGSQPRCGSPGWVGHEWRMRGFYSDECIHCGRIAVEGHNGLAANEEHCDARAKAQNTNQSGGGR